MSRASITSIIFWGHLGWPAVAQLNVLSTEDVWWITKDLFSSARKFKRSAVALIICVMVCRANFYSLQAHVQHSFYLLILSLAELILWSLPTRHEWLRQTSPTLDLFTSYSWPLGHNYLVFIRGLFLPVCNRTVNVSAHSFWSFCTLGQNDPKADADGRSSLTGLLQY